MGSGVYLVTFPLLLNFVLLQTYIDLLPYVSSETIWAASACEGGTIKVKIINQGGNAIGFLDNRVERSCIGPGADKWGWYLGRSVI